jgi:hypothetical protein
MLAKVNSWSSTDLFNMFGGFSNMVLHPPSDTPSSQK